MTKRAATKPVMRFVAFTCLVSLTATAADITLEGEVVRSASRSLLSLNIPGGFDFLEDGSLIFIGPNEDLPPLVGGQKSPALFRRPRRGALQQLMASASNFTVAPDGRTVIVPEGKTSPFTRITVDPLERVSIAQGQASLDFWHRLMLSKTMLIFDANDGIHVAKLSGGPSKLLSAVSPSKGEQTTLSLHQLSHDGDWLLYLRRWNRYNTALFEAVRFDGTDQRTLGFETAMLVGSMAIGMTDSRNIRTQVVDLVTGQTWTLDPEPAQSLSNAKPAGSDAVLMPLTGGLTWFDLRTRNSKVLVPGDKESRMQFDVSVDGARVVTSVHQRGTCRVVSTDVASMKSTQLLVARGVELCLVKLLENGSTVVLAERRDQVVIATIDPKTLVVTNHAVLNSSGGAIVARGNSWGVHTKEAVYLEP